MRSIFNPANFNSCISTHDDNEIYIKDSGYTAENYGIINNFRNDSKDIFAADYAIVNNYGILI